MSRQIPSPGPELQNYLQSLVHKILKKWGLPQTSVVDFHFVSRQNIFLLKKKYFAKPEVTDVLSFPTHAFRPKVNTLTKIPKPVFSSAEIKTWQQDPFLGDIVFCLPVIRQQAKSQNLTVKQELIFLTIHGLLHLFGFDHAQKKQRLNMQLLESYLYKNLFLNVL